MDDREVNKLEPLQIPDFLINRYIQVKEEFTNICYKIEYILNKTIYICYDYNDLENEWCCSYLNRSISCNFKLCIFIDGDANEENSYIIKCKRLAGDGFYLTIFFRKVRDYLKKIDDYNDDYEFIPIYVYNHQERYVQIKIVNNLFEMSKNKMPDVQLTLSQILCEIISVESYRHFLINKDFIHFVCEIICESSSELVQEHCLYVLVDISRDYPSFTYKIMEKKILLQKLFDYAVNMEYYKGLLRRFSIYILVELFNFNLVKIINHFGEDKIRTLLSIIYTINDIMVKKYVNQIKNIVGSTLDENPPLKKRNL